MLGKLLKHEWKATARKYGLFYLILAAVTLFTAAIHAIPTDNVFFVMGEISLIVVYIISLFGVVFCSTGMAVVRFYKNMVSDEGYLTFTLPAKVEQLVISKFLVAVVWQLITVVLCILSLFCVFAVGHIEMGVFFEEFTAVLKEFDGLFPVFVVLMVVGIMYQILIYYLSIAIGQLFGTYKILASVLTYCVLGFVLEMVIGFVLLGVFGLTGMLQMGDAMSVSEGMTGLYLVSAGVSVIIGAVSYFVTCYLLKKKLNLV